MSEKYRIVIQRDGEEIAGQDIEIEDDLRELEIGFTHFDDCREVDRHISVQAKFIWASLMD